MAFRACHRTLELLPMDEVLVDGSCEGVQVGAVEGPVRANPASNLRVDGTR